MQKYEKGANRLSGSRLVQAAEAVGVTPAYFFGTNDANGKNLSEANFDLFKLIDSADMVRLLRAASNQAAGTNAPDQARGVDGSSVDTARYSCTTGRDTRLGHVASSLPGGIL